MPEGRVLRLSLRTQVLGRDDRGRSRWEAVSTPVMWRAQETAILVCDVWDSHWSRGARERVDVIAPLIDQVLRAARSVGVQVIHAPSETMSFYAETPARRLALSVPIVEPPTPQPHLDSELPIDDSDGGSDTGERGWHRAWSRQHPAIGIDQQQDAISDAGPEVYSLMQHKGLQHLLFVGVHANMCVLNRTFGIKQMIRWGVDAVLVRDLTDAMYNPAMRPYVTHDEGTRLVVEYIEKFWAPTVDMEELMQALRG